ncbi:MAG: hypothetical protein PHQ22_09045 [Sulfuricurvum sp.]|nr:hypothetical protein [Sulfuricurvum sp.]
MKSDTLKIIAAHLLSIAIWGFALYVFGSVGIEMIRDSDTAPSVLLIVSLPIFILFSLGLLWVSFTHLSPYLIESFGVELSEDNQQKINSIRHTILNTALVMMVAFLVYRRYIV